MLRDFKAFLLRGNVVDLAVGVAIGLAFATVVEAFTDGMIDPLLGLVAPGDELGRLSFDVGGADFRYGQVLLALLNFVIVAAVLFFLVVVPVNKLMARRGKGPDVESTTRECPECLSAVPAGARRCAFCTSELA